MAGLEDEIRKNVEQITNTTEKPHQQLDLDVPSLATALQSPAEERVDWYLGRGVVFRLGEDRRNSLELYSQVVRVGLPEGGVMIPRREPQVVPEGVVFEDPERFFLSVGPRGDILFQYSPVSPAGTTSSGEREIVAEASTRSVPESVSAERATRLSPPPAPETNEKPKSEKYVGRLGEVKSHTTKQGKLVAEVEITVPDPERPGSSKLVKFAAFGKTAEALARDYQAGQLVTAVGIPHELKRRSQNGREWTERQWYFVQLPKTR